MAPPQLEYDFTEVLPNGEEATMPSLRWTERSHLARWTGVVGIIAIVSQVAVELVR